LAVCQGSWGDEEQKKENEPPQRTTPIFKDGEAQVVDGFKDSDYLSSAALATSCSPATA
jgi:hypothetical protein